MKYRLVVTVKNTGEKIVQKPLPDTSLKDLKEILQLFKKGVNYLSFTDQNNNEVLILADQIGFIMIEHLIEQSDI